MAVDLITKPKDKPLFAEDSFEKYYESTDEGFTVVNGDNRLNRPLFCAHSPSKIFAGDRPFFTISLMTKGGKAGNLRIGIVTDGGSLWLDEAEYCRATYCLGAMRYRLSDPLLDDEQIELEIAPEVDFTGCIVRLTAPKLPPGARLVWVFGGNNGGYSYKDYHAYKALFFAVSDCESNRVEVGQDDFSLLAERVKWDRDKIVICQEPEATLDLKVKVQGQCNVKGEYAIVDAEAFEQPCQVFSSDPTTSTPVCGFVSSPIETDAPIYMVLGVNHSPAKNPKQSFERSIEYWHQVANAIEIKTPEQDLDLAFRSALCEVHGNYSGEAYYHGHLTWMGQYLGWRVLYGPILAGEIDQVKKHTRNHVANQLTEGDDAGFMNPLLEWKKNVAFNMGEVHMHHMSYLYRWTRDVKFLDEIFDSMALYLGWQKRYLDPKDDGLYENVLNTWISDGHWHLGGASAQSSAYMYEAHRLMAQIARHTQRDPKPWTQRAEKVLDQMKQRLWLADRGLYADYIDRIGEGLVHRDPELATIYHPEECETVDLFELRQSCEWTTRTLEYHDVPATDGIIYWSSRWTPNRDGDYVHTVHEMSPSENIHFALSLYRSGKSELAHKVFRGSMAEMFLYGIPGSTSCKIATSGASRSCLGFGDTPGMRVRATVEGLFGMRPRLEENCLDIQPHFPPHWTHAHIKTPHVSLTYQREGHAERYEIADAKFDTVVLRLASSRGLPKNLKIDGKSASLSFVEVLDAPTFECHLNQGSHTVEFESEKNNNEHEPAISIVAAGQSFRMDAGLEIIDCIDPQGALQHVAIDGQVLTATAAQTPDEKTAFLRVRQGPAVFLKTLPLSIRLPIAGLNCHVEAKKFEARFDLVNQLDRPLEIAWTGQVLGQAVTGKTVLAPDMPHTVQFALAKNEMPLPGHSSFQLQTKGDLNTTIVLPFLVESDVSLLNATCHMIPFGFATVFEQMLDNTFITAVPLKNKWYYDTWYTGHMKWHYDADKMRHAINNGVFVSRYGIPFTSTSDGPNCLAITRWENFPTEAIIPIDKSGDKLYIMLAGVTGPMQCYITNIRITVEYDDGEPVVKELVNPDSFDSMGGTPLGAYHISNNLHEVIGSSQSLNPPHLDDICSPRKPRTPDEGAHADIIDIDIDPTRTVKSVRVYAVANEIVCAVLGVTICCKMSKF